MRTVTLTLPRPHASQMSVLHEHKRFNVLCCARRWGKTVLAMDRIVRAALAGKRVAWFSPTYKSLSDAWRNLQTTLHPVTARKNVQEHKLELFGNGVLDCWSLDDPNAGRGRAYHLIIVDEAGFVEDLKTAWEQSIRPMLADYEGSAWFLSTPTGVQHHFHALFQQGQDPLDEDWASWKRPTSTNPHIKPTEIEKARGDLTDLAFAQEYLAEFVTWTGAVFRRITDAVKPTVLTPAAIIGVDWAGPGGQGDYTVFVAMSPAGHVIGIDRFRGQEYSVQRDRLRAFWENYGKRSWILAEENAMGGPIVNQLQHEGLPIAPFSTTPTSKPAIIEALALAFERGIIHIPNDPVLIGELQAMQGIRMPSGHMKYGAPKNQHDDCVMALAFAWAGLTAPRNARQYLDLEHGGVTDEYRPYQISPV